MLGLDSLASKAIFRGRRRGRLALTLLILTLLAGASLAQTKMPSPGFSNVNNPCPKPTPAAIIAFAGE